MSKNKKFFSLMMIFIISSFFATHAQVLNDAQLLKPGNWVYEAMQDLSTESRTAIFLDTQPISAGELKFYLSKIDYDKLSESGKALYNKVENYLYTSDAKFLPDDIVTKFSSGLIFTPEFYIRTNDEIQTTAKPYFQNYPLEIPLKFGFADAVTFQLNLFVGKDRDGYLSPDAYTNVPLSMSDFAFELQRFAYGNVGHQFTNWGFSATMGKEGFSIGNSKLGSVIYNSTFETDYYSVLSVYSSSIKYNLILSQVDSSRYLYLHNFNMRILPNFKLSITEGGLRDGPLQLRYLNPVMIVHQFYSETDFTENYSMTDISNYCAYLGITFEYQPIKNLRLYLNYAQNELQFGTELSTLDGKLLPDSYGIQFGFDYLIPHKNENYFKINVESMYNTPFLYLKQSPNMCLIKYEKVFDEKTKYANYIGSPLGSDVFALNLSLDYKKPQKWSIGFNNLFTAKGEINENTIFETKEIIDDKGNKITVPSYYPIIAYENGLLSEEAAIAYARSIRLTGTLQYKNDISLSYEYFFNDKLKFATEGTYSLIFNNKNIKGDFQQGFELKLAVSYNIF